MTAVLALVYGGLFLIILSNYFYLRWLPPKTGVRETEHSSHPMVSVLVPARNEAENLRRLLPSIRSQAYPRFEIIVFDDASDDDTTAVVSSIAARTGDESITLLRGGDLPGGWTGKSHALHRAAQEASGDLFLFLDADTEFIDDSGLGRLVSRYLAAPEPTVLTGFPRMKGGALLLVSLVPFAIFGFLPWLLVQWTNLPALSALNGQCWMIDADLYRRHEPHRVVRDHVLEDVEIGRYLKSQGVRPIMIDLREKLSVYMYVRFAEAWKGFQKNAYPLAGGTPTRVSAAIAVFVVLFLAAPTVWPWTLGAVWLLKAASDRLAKFPLWVTLCAPISIVLGIGLLADSMRTHLRGRAEWKGRQVG